VAFDRDHEDRHRKRVAKIDAIQRNINGSQITQRAQSATVSITCAFVLLVHLCAARMSAMPFPVTAITKLIEQITDAIVARLNGDGVEQARCAAARLSAFHRCPERCTASSTRAPRVSASCWAKRVCERMGQA
jgi:hypothetical protein